MPQCILLNTGELTPQLSPPQRPLCIVGRLLCCGEAGEKEKESARGTIIDILIGIPSGSLCGGDRHPSVFIRHRQINAPVYLSNTGEFNAPVYLLNTGKLRYLLDTGKLTPQCICCIC